MDGALPVSEYRSLCVSEPIMASPFREFLNSLSSFADGTRAGSIRGMASGRISESDMYDVARFLNRLLGLEPGLQNR